jgi:hypothetical protein
MKILKQATEAKHNTYFYKTVSEKLIFAVAWLAFMLLMRIVIFIGGFSLNICADELAVFKFFHQQHPIRRLDV